MEIGCGSGKIYDYLSQTGFNGSYTGIEMASYVINANQQNYPNARWQVGSVYDLINQSAQYECCLAFFVLEHLIYPERALESMLHSLKPGGIIILVFPDFSCSGIFPSQKIGIRPGAGAKDKLSKGRILDAIISYLEGGMMRRSLHNFNEKYGRFVVNINPYCLHKDCQQLIPDMDAVYISNKKEVETWSNENNCSVSYPMGVEELFSKIAFMCIRKN